MTNVVFFSLNNKDNELIIEQDGKGFIKAIMIVWSSNFRCIEFERLDMQRICSGGDINLEFGG